MTIFRRIISVLLFVGAFCALGFVPLDDNLIPAHETQAESVFLVLLLLLCVACIIAGFIALPPRKPEHAETREDLRP
ncbi:hypothetical protein [Bradyrhizobium sp. 27S5]|uniref:hypothetical protein n=1 Tax=Bradyrhizobium sp. 27S5 TaxID=3139728 RepID=UPI0030CDA123